MTTLKDSLTKNKIASPDQLSKTKIRYAKHKPFEYADNIKSSERMGKPKIKKNHSEIDYSGALDPVNMPSEHSQIGFAPNILLRSNGSLCSEDYYGHSVGVQAQSFNISVSIQADRTASDCKSIMKQSIEMSMNGIDKFEKNKSIQADSPFKNEDIQCDFSQISEGIQVDFDRISQSDFGPKSQNFQVNMSESEPSIMNLNTASQNDIQCDFAWQFSYKSSILNDNSRIIGIYYQIKIRISITRFLIIS